MLHLHRSNYRRAARVFAPLAILLVLLAGVGYVVLRSGSQNSDSEADELLIHTVARSNFNAFVTEPGDLVSSSNIDIRCQVKSRGTPGSSVVKIVEEGTQVQEGDFLVQFDDSLLQNELIAQKIVVANDKAALIQVESALANAERTLSEYSNGLFQQECDVLESAVFVAEEELRKSELELQSAERLAAKGMLKPLQVSATTFAVEKAKKDVAAAQRALKVYKEFTKEKTTGELQAEIEKQKANVEAAKFTLELSQHRQQELQQQIDHCHVTAPGKGQVVYENERNRGEPMVIEEGTIIRYNQIIIRLPDVSQMQVDVKINESHINRIRPGQPAKIILDADPENPLTGEVITVAPFPFPMRWHGSPLEYGVEIAIVDPPSTIRPGLRAKVQIFYEFEEDVLQVPLAAVVAHHDGHYCLVQGNSDWEVRQVEIGASNSHHVVIRDGLEVGDQVTMTPFRFIQRSDLPEASETPEKKPQGRAAPAAGRETFTSSSR